VGIPPFYAIADRRYDMDQICVGIPCAVTYDIAECYWASRDTARGTIAASRTSFSVVAEDDLEGLFLPQNHCYCQQQDNNYSANLHRPERYFEQSLNIPRNVATSNTTLTLNPIVLAKRPLLRRSRPSVAARKTGIMETGPASTNRVMIFLMLRAEIVSII